MPSVFLSEQKKTKQKNFPKIKTNTENKVKPTENEETINTNHDNSDKDLNKSLHDFGSPDSKTASPGNPTKDQRSGTPSFSHDPSIPTYENDTSSNRIIEKDLFFLYQQNYARSLVYNSHFSFPPFSLESLQQQHLAQLQQLNNDKYMQHKQNILPQNFKKIPPQITTRLKVQDEEKEAFDSFKTKNILKDFENQPLFKLQSLSKTHHENTQNQPFNPQKNLFQLPHQPPFVLVQPQRSPSSIHRPQLRSHSLSSFSQPDLFSTQPLQLHQTPESLQPQGPKKAVKRMFTNSRERWRQQVKRIDTVTCIVT